MLSLLPPRCHCHCNHASASCPYTLFSLSLPAASLPNRPSSHLTQGSIGLTPFPPVPAPLAEYMNDADFVSKLRQYNALLQMASSTAEECRFTHGVADVSNALLSHRLPPSSSSSPVSAICPALP
jgi:hypothetical protein